jgi:hypothetical protein
MTGLKIHCDNYQFCYRDRYQVGHCDSHQCGDPGVGGETVDAGKVIANDLLCDQKSGFRSPRYPQSAKSTTPPPAPVSS